MKMQKIPDGVVVVVSKLFQLKVEGDELVVSCRESPIKGRVNKELIKELSRIFKKRVEIIAGFTSKQKKVLIKDINSDEANAVLSKNLT
jgi:uncharacterized protein (TIGR00251 family)